MWNEECRCIREDNLDNSPPPYQNKCNWGLVSLWLLFSCSLSEATTPTRTVSVWLLLRMFSLIVSGIGTTLLCVIGISGIVFFFVQYAIARKVRRHQEPNWPNDYLAFSGLSPSSTFLYCLMENRECPKFTRTKTFAK